MKNFFTVVLVLAFIGFTQKSEGQEIGIRTGSVLDNKLAIDAIISIGEYSRVHADITFSEEAVAAATLWNFSFKPINDFPDLHWYLGAGPYAILGNDFDIGVKSEIGIEYKFIDLPITLGLDVRPGIEIIDNTKFNFGLGLNIRYVISQ